eukprot:COSAG02_NODE_1968_length_10205_cov_11.178120_2_plen_58_part_00
MGGRGSGRNTPRRDVVVRSVLVRDGALGTAPAAAPSGLCGKGESFGAELEGGSERIE